MKKNIFSNHRTLDHVKHKLAATLLTIAATFCSIIIETRPQKGHSQHEKVKSLKLIERMTNIVIIFVLSTNATYCILLDKNKNIYATFLIIFVGEAVFMFQKIILELTLIDNPIDLNCLYNKFP